MRDGRADIRDISELSQSYDPKHPTFLYKVNAHEIGKHFKEHSRSGKYHTYVSKRFFGAVIRCRNSILSVDQQRVVMSARLKRRYDRKQSVTGIKIDLMQNNDPRLDKYGVEKEDLITVDLQIFTVQQNIVLNPNPAILSAYFFDEKSGSSVINFIIK